MNAIAVIQNRRGLAAFLCAALLVPRSAEAATNGAAAPTVVETFFQRAKLAPEARQRVEEALRGREALLGYLPVAQLERVEVQANGFELVFDFGKKDEKRITIPSETLWVLDKKGRLLEVETDEQDLVIHERVRLTFDDKGGLHLRKGDLEGVMGIFRRDLEVHTLRCPNRLVRDDEGRVVLKLDAEGRPVLQDGRPIARTADEWLMIEAGSLQFEFPL